MWTRAYIKTEIYTLGMQGENLGCQHPLLCQGWWDKNKTVPGDSEKIATQYVNLLQMSH